MTIRVKWEEDGGKFLLNQVRIVEKRNDWLA
jgi:hypothetical protein